MTDELKDTAPELTDEEIKAELIRAAKKQNTLPDQDAAFILKEKTQDEIADEGTLIIKKRPPGDLISKKDVKHAPDQTTT